MTKIPRDDLIQCWTDGLIALEAAFGPLPVSCRHIKSGGSYTIDNVAFQEKDLVLVVEYRDQKIRFTRPLEEFLVKYARNRGEEGDS